MKTTASWDGWSYSFWSTSNAVSKELVASVAEPVEPSRQFMRVHTRVRRGNQAMLWLVCIFHFGGLLLVVSISRGAMLIFTIGSLYGRRASSLSSCLCSVSTCLVDVSQAASLCAGSSLRKRLAQLSSLSVRASARAVIEGDDMLAARLFRRHLAIVPEASASANHLLFPASQSDFSAMSGSSCSGQRSSAFSRLSYSSSFARRYLRLDDTQYETFSLALSLLFLRAFALHCIMAFCRAYDVWREPCSVEVSQDGLRWRIGRAAVALFHGKRHADGVVLFLPAPPSGCPG